MRFLIFRTSRKEIKWKGLEVVPEYFNQLQYHIEIKDLDELMKLSKKFGSLIINPPDNLYNEQYIEIYDYYRE